ncbi:Hsp90 ATPase activator [Ordospora colligata]|nr:Hsp90 ATPase activator [Ordospora colligata]
MDTNTGECNIAEVDISEWAAQKIKDALEAKGYCVNEMSVNVKMHRQGTTIRIVYIVSFECVKDGVSCGVKGFHSIYDGAEGIEDFDWFAEFFAEMEAEAVLRYGSNVVDECIERQSENKVCQSINTPEAKTKKMIHTTRINCEADEICAFLLDKQYICVWGVDVRVDDNKVVIGNVTIQNLKVEKQHDGAMCVTMYWKFDGWSMFSDVSVHIESKDGISKVTVKQEQVPITAVKNVETWWREAAFSRIALNFGFSIMPVEDE